jgi:hypothetical protein
MTTRMFGPAELVDMLLDEATEVASAPWRHGRSVTLVFWFQDAHWRITVREHHDDGFLIDGPHEGTKVHQVERMTKVWEPTS